MVIMKYSRQVFGILIFIYVQCMLQIYYRRSMQKQITFTEIKATFTKDFETFSKMDPFLVFTIAKCEAKTETAQNAGKEPIWKAQIKLNYYDEEMIKIEAFQEDLTSNEKMGSGQIDVKSLKPSGTLQIQIKGQSESIGTVSLKYAVKTLPPTPILTIKNIKCDFYKETKFMLKTKPYFAVQAGGKNIVTQPIQQNDGKMLHWKNETLRIKIKDNDKINFIMYDKEDNDSKIFAYSASTKEFRTLSGRKSFNVIDKNYEPLGVVTFDYETQHLVNKQQSKKNEEAFSKDSNELTLIIIEKIKGKLLAGSQDIFFKINLGPNMVITPYIENAKKDFVLKVDQQFYAEKKQNKMIFAAYDKDLISDDILGVGELPLENLSSGEKTVSLKNSKGESFGDIILVLSSQKVVCKSIQLSNLKVQLKKGTDIIGQSEPYVVARVGGWSGRTECQQGNNATFKRAIDLKFSMEKQLMLQLWDHDLNDDDKIVEQAFDISGFKGEGEISREFKTEKNSGKFEFKYKTKNVEAKKETVQKSQKNIKKSEKKIEDPPAKPEEKKESIGSEDHLRTQKQQLNSIDRSRDTFKLPSIAQSRNWGDKIYNKQSAATLQKSVHAYSMPKANRFGYGSKYQGEPSYYMDTCFKPNGSKGVGFGFGNKRQFPEWMQKNMKQNPAPGAYFDQHSTSPDFRPKGPTFGIGHKYYEKVTIPRQKSAPRSIKQKERLRPLERHIGRK